VLESSPAERAVPWLLRAVWIAVLVFGGRAVDDALPDAGAATTWIAVAGWIVGVACMAVPAVVSLTATRAIVPLAVPLAVVASFTGADPVDGALFVGSTVLAMLLAASSPFGRAFVQAAAYGDEDRHLLRPPLAFAVFAGVLWLVWAGFVTVASIATARADTVVALVCWVIVVGGGAVLLPRWHRLSLRWIVLVPAGVVVHDHVALAETLMLRRSLLTAVGLALVGTDAADLTGGTPGHALEFRTREPITAVLGAAAGERAGTAIHLTGFLVAPTRPGQVLTAATRRRLPVGTAG
jgi:hypothetical protein